MPSPLESFSGMNTPVGDPDKQVNAPVTGCPLARKVRVRIVVKDWLFGLRKNCRYKLEIGGVPFEGNTGSDALVDHLVPEAATTGTLSVWVDKDSDEPQVWPLELTPMDPLPMETGAEVRLANLGFTDDDDPSLEALTEEMKALFKLPTETTLDSDTIRLLNSLYSPKCDDENSFYDDLALPLAMFQDLAAEGNPTLKEPDPLDPD